MDINRQDLQDALNSDYAKAWQKSVNANGETVHKNDILSMTITETNLTDKEIQETFYKQK